MVTSLRVYFLPVPQKLPRWAMSIIVGQLMIFPGLIWHGVVAGADNLPYDIMNGQLRGPSESYLCVGRFSSAQWLVSCQLQGMVEYQYLATSVKVSKVSEIASTNGCHGGVFLSPYRQSPWTALRGPNVWIAPLKGGYLNFLFLTSSAFILTIPTFFSFLLTIVVTNLP
jgi:hypothetical protein